MEIVTHICDRCPKEDEIKAVHIGRELNVRGSVVVLDLCNACGVAADGWERDGADWQRLGRNPAERPSERSGRSPEERAETARVRAWARSQGLTVAPRGRITAELRAQYRRAIGLGGSQAPSAQSEQDRKDGHRPDLAHS